MQDCHENVDRDFTTVDVGQWTLKTLLYCLWSVYTMISTLDKITTYIHTYVCAFDEKNQPVFVHQRIVPDQAHWDRVAPKLETFWRVCILPEILGINLMSVKFRPTLYVL